MKLEEFPNPKFTPEFLNKTLALEDIEELLDGVDNYLNIVKSFIFTDIEHDYDANDPRLAYSWCLHIVSTNLARSLYLRNAFVSMANNGNYVSAVIQLKAWLEITACLAAIRNILLKKPSPADLLEFLKRYTLGNRGTGNFRVGTVESINVKTMIDKGDLFHKEIEIKTSGTHSLKINGAYFSDYYDNVSNASHPSYDASELVSNVKDTKTIIKDPARIGLSFALDRGQYGGLLLIPEFTKAICIDIFFISKDELENVNSNSFFS